MHERRSVEIDFLVVKTKKTIGDSVTSMPYKNVWLWRRPLGIDRLALNGVDTGSGERISMKIASHDFITDLSYILKQIQSKNFETANKTH